MNSSTIKILVVDDSALYRQSIRNVLRDVDGIQLVGVAKNGIDALQKIEQLDPDLLTLDVEMPDMNGIELLREIKQRGMRPKAIMVSSFTAKGAQVTTDALMEGAFDFILKPSAKDSASNREQLKDALLQKIWGFRESLDRRPASALESGRAEATVETVPDALSECRVVILGASTGGPAALKTVLPKLPAELSIPVLVVQHMPPNFTRSLAERLNATCELEVVEATDQMPATGGKIIIAAGGKQLKLSSRDNQLIVRITEDPPENGVRPSVDHLLRSAVEEVRGDALAVIMTGMGRDGLEGCRALKQAGGFVFAQSQSDCVVYGMPKAVAEAQLADRTLPLGKVAPAIVRHVKRSRRSSG